MALDENKQPVLVDSVLVHTVRLIRGKTSRKTEKLFEQYTEVIRTHGGRIHGCQINEHNVIAIYFDYPKSHDALFRKAETPILEEMI